MKSYRWNIVCLLVFSYSFFVSAETVFTYKSSESGADVRFQYDYRLLVISTCKNDPSIYKFSARDEQLLNLFVFYSNKVVSRHFLGLIYFYLHNHQYA